MNTYKKLAKDLLKDFQKQDYINSLNNEIRYFKGKITESKFDLSDKVVLQFRSFQRFLKFDYQEKMLLELIQNNNENYLLDCINSFDLARLYYDKYNNDEYREYETKEDYLFEFWCLAVFFEHSELEKYTRKILKEDLVLGQTGYRTWQYPEHYIPCVLPIVKNMIASVENDELTLLEKGTDYDEFFDSSTVTKDALRKQDELHLARTKGKKRDDGEYFRDPVTRLNHAVFPFQMLAWYKLAKKQNIELDVQGTIIEPFINIQYRKGIQDPDLLKLIGVLSETVGEDVLKLIE